MVISVVSLLVAIGALVVAILERRERRRAETAASRDRMGEGVDSCSRASRAARQEIHDFRTVFEMLTRRLERQTRESLSKLDHVDEFNSAWTRRIAEERRNPSLRSREYDVPRATAAEYESRCLVVAELFRDLSAILKSLLGGPKNSTQQTFADAAANSDSFRGSSDAAAARKTK